MRATRRPGTFGGTHVRGVGERVTRAPAPVQPSTCPRAPRPRLTLLGPENEPEEGTSGAAHAEAPRSMRRRTALATFLAGPESGLTHATLLRALDGIDDGTGAESADRRATVMRLMP